MTFTEEVDAGALVFCNHSGGKDSQAMYLHLREVVPTDQLIIIHADLGELVEWGGVKDHIRANIDGRKLEIAHAYYRDGSNKDLLGYVRKRGMWPSNSSVFLLAGNDNHGAWSNSKADTPASTMLTQEGVSRAVREQ